MEHAQHPGGLWPDGPNRSMSLGAYFLKRYVNPVFVETGTYYGGGVLLAKELGFREVYSIEINPEYHRAAAVRLAHLEGIHLFLGDTVRILPGILSSLEKKATIFIDAHPVLVDAPDLGAVKHYPLVSELEIIRDHSKRKDHTILVDDRHAFREYGTSDEDVIRRLHEINPGYRISVDRNLIAAEIA